MIPDRMRLLDGPSWKVRTRRHRILCARPSALDAPRPGRLSSRALESTHARLLAGHARAPPRCRIPAPPPNELSRTDARQRLVAQGDCQSRAVDTRVWTSITAPTLPPWSKT